jgi:hypothetical protein
MKKSALVSAIFTFLTLSSLTPLFSQPAVSAFDVYDCLGRSWDDPVVHQFTQRLGEKDSTWWWNADKITHRYACGVNVYVESHEVQLIEMDLERFEGPAPFGLLRTTRKKEILRLFPGLHGDGYLWGGSGPSCGIDSRGHLQVLMFFRPMANCLLKAHHFAPFDLAALQPQAGESNTDFHARIRKEEDRLRISLNRTHFLADSIGWERSNLMQIPLADESYTIVKEGKGMLYLKRGPTYIVVHLPNGKMKWLKDRLPSAELVYVQWINWGTCQIDEDYELVQLRVAGKAFQSGTTWLPQGVQE